MASGDEAIAVYLMVPGRARPAAYLTLPDGFQIVLDASFLSEGSLLVMLAKAEAGALVEAAFVVNLP